MQVIETGRVSSRVTGEGFLGTGVMYAVFQSVGDLSCCRGADDGGKWFG